MAPTTVIGIESTSEFNSHISSLPASALQVLYFHAPWAAPCAQMSTVLDALASTYDVASPPTISFLAINAEDLPDISEDHDVTAVPFVVLKRGDQTLETVSGSDAAKVRAAVEQHAGQGTGAGKPGVTLPAAQSVNRPDASQQAEPVDAKKAEFDATATANGALGSEHKAGSEQSSAKDLSKYAPGANAKETAPEYSSQTEPGLSTKDDKESGQEDLNTRLASLVSAAPCMLFMKGTPSAPQCGFSRQLVSILREQGVRYGFFNILADDEVRQGLKEYADWPTFPQLWLSGELVGGLDIVKEEMEANVDFFKEYSVGKSDGGIGKGGPAAPEDQKAPA